MDLERINNNLSLRSKAIFDPIKNGMSVAVIGAGSIGSNLVMLLARLGLTDITVYDYDKVEDHNLGHQAFRIQDLGKNKVDALKEVVQDATGTEIKAVAMKANGKDIEADVVVLAVDSMKYRDMLYKNCKYLYALDCRMAGEEIQVYAWAAHETDKYAETLFPDDEAIDLPCGGKAIGYISYIASGLMENTITKIMKGAAYPFEQNFCSKTLTYYYSKDDC